MTMPIMSCSGLSQCFEFSWFRKHLLASSPTVLSRHACLQAGEAERNMTTAQTAADFVDLGWVYSEHSEAPQRAVLS